MIFIEARDDETKERERNDLGRNMTARGSEICCRSFPKGEGEEVANKSFFSSSHALLLSGRLRHSFFLRSLSFLSFYPHGHLSPAPPHVAPASQDL